ncbi:rRNA pseudouridine synthase [bacterium]|nr:rRNA pseudouridine synthase [bacterium]
MRLNKYLAQCGVATSRRKADELIATGVVKINGKIVMELGAEVNPKDKVEVYNKYVNLPQFKYVIFYKPAGYITTLADEKARKTIYDILPDELKKLKPVGRLDKDSTGLLILTNDGDLINDLTHPAIKVAKNYRVVAKGKLKMPDLEEMAKGIEIEKGQIAYADSQVLGFEGKDTVLQITLYQGLNRQIRKMLDYLGHPVISLKRISCGTLNLDGLKRGEFKYLKPKQVKDLKKYVEKLKSI